MREVLRAIRAPTEALAGRGLGEEWFYLPRCGSEPVAEGRVEYDAEGDVLYLHVGDPSRAVDFDETPEGPAARFDPDGELVGLTLVRPKWLL